VVSGVIHTTDHKLKGEMKIVVNENLKMNVTSGAAEARAASPPVRLNLSDS
jgi:hypothetical protein